MQIGSQSGSQIVPAAKRDKAPEPAFQPTHTTVVKRADLPKSVQEQDARKVVFPTSMLLTKTDIALIERATGIKTDYETGEFTPAEGHSEKASNFIMELQQMRYDKWLRQEPVAELTPEALTKLFDEAKSRGINIDKDMLDKALAWFEERAEKAPADATGLRVDVLA